MARWHKNRNARNKGTTHRETRININIIRKGRLQSQQKEIYIFLKTNSMAGTYNLTRRYQTEWREDGSNQQSKIPNKHEHIEIFFSERYNT